MNANQSNISQDRYESDYTTNTQNSEGTFVFKAETEFNTTANVNSNSEIEPTLIVNATKSNSILCKRSRRTILKKSELS